MRSGLSQIILRVIFIFVVSIFIINIFRITNNSNSGFFGFENLLNNLSNSNTIQLRFDISSFTIGGDWGIFDGIRQFFNAFATILGVLIWFGANLINLILFLFQFVRLLFV